MSNCYYCGKEITDKQAIQKGNYIFCDNLCRYSFEKNGEQPKVKKEMPDNKLKNGKNKNIMIATLVSTIVAAIIGIIVQSSVRSFFSPKVTSAKVLNVIASKINESLPMMLDSDTELSTTIGLDGKIQYHYRLVNYSIEQIDTAQLMPSLRENIANGSCTAKETRELLNKGVSLEYVYHDKNKKEVSSFILTKSQCD